MLTTQLVGFYPRTVCEKISEKARLAAIDVTNKLDAYLAQLANFEREADIVSFLLMEKERGGFTNPLFHLPSHYNKLAKLIKKGTVCF
jgi:hypothetical protein